MNSQRHLPNRIRYAIAVVLTMCGILTLSAGPASADPRVCCFEIVYAGGDDYVVWAGIDIPMSRAAAQAILDQPGDPVDAWAMGDDVFDDAEFRIPLTWVGVTDVGLSAEFQRTVPSAMLDEDPAPTDADELYARIRLFDPAGTRTFRTLTLTSPF